eukprot:1803753-Pleurochrysis_carterae.AAC.1
MHPELSEAPIQATLISSSPCAELMRLPNSSAADNRSGRYQLAQSRKFVTVPRGVQSNEQKLLSR